MLDSPGWGSSMRYSLPIVLILASALSAEHPIQSSEDNEEIQNEPLFKAEDLPETAFDRRPAVIENSITEAKDED